MKKILIVDDSSLIRKATKHELVTGGYDVLGAVGFQEGLHLYNSNDIDLLILDIEMPEKNGFELLEEIQQTEKYQKHETPAIFFTGKDKAKFREKGFEIGATDFLLKSFQEGELLLAVNKILKSSLRFEGLTALVVDDMAVCRKVIINELANVGIKSIQAANGKEALKIFTEKQEEINLIITDKEMPIMGGLKFIKELKRHKRAKEIPIVVITASPDKDSMLDFFNNGISDYIVKPFLKEEFIARIFSQLESSLLREKLGSGIKHLLDLHTLKDKFLAICSHDLKTPLNGILGYTEILQESENLTEEDLKVLQQIHDSGSYLFEIISNLLDLKKIDFESSIKFNKFCVLTLIKACIKGMEMSARGKLIDMRLVLLDSNTSEVMILGDKLALKRLINNLLSNAIKFTPEGGVVEIQLKKEKGELQISVKDNGIGISEDRLADIFNEFTKESTAGTDGELGTGLGLSIVKKIAEKHNGTASVTSNLGDGSTFTIKMHC